MRRWLSIALCTAICLLCASCSDYKELSSYDVVAGIGIDCTQNGEFLVSAELLKFDRMMEEGGSRTVILQSQHKVLAIACENLSELSGRELYWGQTQLIAIGSSAVNRLSDVLDFFTRNIYYSSQSAVCAVKGVAAEIFSAGDVQQGQAVSFRIVQGLSQRDVRWTLHCDVNLTAAEYMSVTSSVALPLLVSVSVGEGYESIYGGGAVYRGNMFRGYIGSEDDFMLSLLRGFPCHMELDVMDCCVQLRDFKVGLDGKDGEYCYIIRCKGSVISMPRSSSPITGEEQRRLNEAAAKALEEKLGHFLTALRTLGSGDVMQLADMIARQGSAFYNTHRDSWDETFDNVKVAFTAECDMESSGRR